jgi:hypothetical protein
MNELDSPTLLLLTDKEEKKFKGGEDERPKYPHALTTDTRLLVPRGMVNSTGFCPLNWSQRPASDRYTVLRIWSCRVHLKPKSLCTLLLMIESNQLYNSRKWSGGKS